jgi:hypothetical protein
MRWLGEARCSEVTLQAMSQKHLLLTCQPDDEGPNVAEGNVANWDAADGKCSQRHLQYRRIVAR